MASPQMSRVLMSLFHKSVVAMTPRLTLRQTLTTQERCSQLMTFGGKDAFAELCKAGASQAGRCEPCVYNNKGTGCWYGDECRYCHLCTPEQVRKNQSRRFYMERALRKEKKFDRAQGAALCMDMKHGMSRRE